MLNRKLRSASHPFFSGTKFDKPSVRVKPYENPRKPLPRISIKLPSQSTLMKSTGSQRVKLDEIANPISGVTNHPRIVSERSREKQSIIVSGSQLIQSARTGITAALDDKTSSEQTLPDFIKGDKLVMSEQSASPKLPHKNQPSPAGQIGEQALSLTDIDTGFDEDDHEDDVADDVQSEPLMEEALFPSKTPANSSEQVPQAESVIERSTPLIHHKHSLPELRLQYEPVRQSQEADVNPRTQLHQLLMAPLTVSSPSSTPNQLSQGTYPQSICLPSTSAAHQNPRLQGTSGGSLPGVTHNHQAPHSRGVINNTSSPSYYVVNLMNPTAKLPHPSLKKKSSSATENPDVKRACLETITRNALSRQEPSSATVLHLLDNSVVQQVPRLAQKHPKKTSRQPISNARRDFGINAGKLSVSQQRMNTPTASNRPNSADYSRFCAEQSQDRHYLAMQEYHLQHMSHLSNAVWQPNIGQIIDRRAHPPVLMNREFTLQSKQNSIGQPNQPLPQCNIQFVPLSVDYMPEILRHGETSLRESIDRAHPNSKPSTQNVERNFKFSALNSVSYTHLTLPTKRIV